MDASIAGVEYSVTTSSINEARQLFKSAANRLLSIGDWNRLCSGLSAVFRLLDASGRVLNRKARPHDLFHIGRSDEHDALEVVRVVTVKKPSGKAESIAIEVRRSGPTEGEMTGLVELRRYNNIVTAAVHDSSRELTCVPPLEWRSLLARILG